MRVNYNPDVLNCLANLSSDEVFTPPKLVNEMLDMLPEVLFESKETTFLDPVCKTGVFLREIAKRLDEGLQKVIPDRQKRIDHIFSKQLFGIAITEITALLSRRSVYCSKKANGNYSVCSAFDDIDGNIKFKRIEHTWGKGRCRYCGASKKNYKRGSDMETHAYEFIHTHKPEEIFNMKFDVIIGNPPYQLNDGGGTGSSAMPIYQKFIVQAKKLNPRYITLITPSRWFSGGRGLEEFRVTMLHDDRIRIIHDYLKASDCFPGVEIKGGVSYFLWDRDNRGDCEINTHENGKITSTQIRPLLEKGTDVFIRFNQAITILKKVQSFNEDSFSKIVSANDPFGFDIREKDSFKRVKPKFALKPFKNSIRFYYYNWEKKGIGYIDKNLIRKNQDWINKIKIFITKAYGAGEDYPHQILNKPFIGKVNSCSTETYLIIGPFEDMRTAQNSVTYISTRFFRFLVLLKKITQGAYQSVYQYVPVQNFNEEWSDKKLYKKYKLTDDEIAFIESMVRPMENGNE